MKRGRRFERPDILIDRGLAGRGDYDSQGGKLLNADGLVVKSRGLS